MSVQITDAFPRGCGPADRNYTNVQSGADASDKNTWHLSTAPTFVFHETGTELIMPRLQVFQCSPERHRIYLQGTLTDDFPRKGLGDRN